MRLMHYLGYAGLVPFVALTLAQFWPQLLGFSLSYSLFQSYSLLILAFMAGVLWPALYHHSNQQLPFWVVSLALTGWFSSLLQPAAQLLLLAATFLALRLLEIKQGINDSYAPAYQKLRNHLTTVVVLCHLLFWWTL